MVKTNPYEFGTQDIISAFNDKAREQGVWGVVATPSHFDRRKITALLGDLSPIQLLWSIDACRNELQQRNQTFDFRSWLKWVDFYKDSIYSEDLCASIVLRKYFKNRTIDLVFCYKAFLQYEESWFPTPKQKEEQEKAKTILEDIKRRL